MSFPDAEASCSFQDSSMSINVFQLVTEGCYHRVQWDSHVHWPFSPTRYLMSPENQWNRVWLQHQHQWGQPAAHSKVKLWFTGTREPVWLSFILHSQETHIQPMQKWAILLYLPWASMSIVFYSILIFSDRAQSHISYLRLHLSYFLHRKFSARREGWSHCTSHPLLWVSTAPLSSWLAACIEDAACTLRMWL